MGQLYPVGILIPVFLHSFPPLWSLRWGLQSQISLCLRLVLGHGSCVSCWEPLFHQNFGWSCDEGPVLLGEEVGHRIFRASLIHDETSAYEFRAFPAPAGVHM